MWALIKFQYRTWKRSPMSIFGFFIPTILMVVMAPMTGGMNLQGITGNVITITLISAGLMNFGFILFELRKSIIMKRIGSTQITKTEAILAFMSWNGFVCLIQVGWILFLSFILSAGVSNYYLTSMNFSVIDWGGVVFGVFVGLALSLVIGFFLVAISKNIEIFNMYTMLYFFMATFVGGLFFPSSPNSPAQYEWLNWIGYFVPHTYIAEMLGASFSAQGVVAASGVVDGFALYDPSIISGVVAGGSVWNLSSGYTIQLISGPITFPGSQIEFMSVINSTTPNWKAAMNIFIPIGVTGVTLFGGVKLFKWDF